MTRIKTVKSIMDKKVVYANVNSTLKEVSKLLIDNTLSGMPVIDDKGELVGFVSERDIIKAISVEKFEQKKAKDIMTKGVISISEDTSCEEASQIFSKYPFRYIPICKNKKIVGIISRKNVIEKLMSQYY